jgi:hypothetical protein
MVDKTQRPVRFTLITIVLLSLASVSSVAAKGDPEIVKPERCPITQPGGNVPPGNVPRGKGGSGWFGNEALSTNVHMWSESGAIPVDEGHRWSGGGYGDFKWAWYRFSPGKLEIEGHRIDGPAAPMTASVPDGYGDLGFQVSGLIFPTAGCWEVTGRIGAASLTFVTLVIPPPFPVTWPGWSRGWPGTSGLAGDWTV